MPRKVMILAIEYATLCLDKTPRFGSAYGSAESIYSKKVRK